MVPRRGTRNSMCINEIGNPHSLYLSADDTGACLPQRTTILGDSCHVVQVPRAELNQLPRKQPPHLC